MELEVNVYVETDGRIWNLKESFNFEAEEGVWNLK